MQNIKIMRSVVLDYRSKEKNRHRGADKSLARPTTRCIFYGENISFDVSLVIYIYTYIYIYIYIVLIFLQL
jgi:hypothetical protein